jgi:GNAT superfamily N-acetyltransferase
MRESGAKERHRASVWGMYVAPRGRRRGLGRGLLMAALAHARTWTEVEQVNLGVTDAAGPARRLYESAGFRCWGTEPRALRWQGQCLDEHHLTYDLRDRLAGG